MKSTVDPTDVDRRAIEIMTAVGEKLGDALGWEAGPVDATAMLCIAAIIAKGMGGQLEEFAETFKRLWNELPDTEHIRKSSARACGVPGLMAYERPDPYRRDPGGPFDSLERERYAKARAKGAAIKSAATEAGISATAAYGFERNEAMRLRVRELRAGAETYVGVSLGWLLNQLKRNAIRARKAGNFKASNEALGLIAKVVQRQPSLGKDQPRALAPDVSRQDVHADLTRRFHARIRGTELVPIEARGVETERTRDDEDDPEDEGEPDEDGPDDDDDDEQEAAE